MEDRLKSRKFWLTLLTEVLIAILAQLGVIPADTVAPSMAGVAGAYALGQGYADAHK